MKLPTVALQLIADDVDRLRIQQMEFPDYVAMLPDDVLMNATNGYMAKYGTEVGVQTINAIRRGLRSYLRRHALAWLTRPTTSLDMFYQYLTTQIDAGEPIINDGGFGTNPCLPETGVALVFMADVVAEHPDVVLSSDEISRVWVEWASLMTNNPTKDFGWFLEQFFPGGHIAECHLQNSGDVEATEVLETLQGQKEYTRMKEKSEARLKKVNEVKYLYE